MPKKKYNISMPKYDSRTKRGDVRNSFITLVSNLSDVSLRTAKKSFDKEQIELDPNDADFGYLVRGLYNTCKITLIDAEYPEPVDIKEINEDSHAYT